MTDLHPELRDVPHPLPVPNQVLAIGAHPDDVEFGAAGTLAAWAARGARVTVFVVTDGSKGTWDPAVPRDALVETRRAEQHAAAGVLGIAEIRFGDHPDGELEYSMALRAEMCGLVRTVRPDVVLTHDPWQRYQLHPDHRVAGLAVVDGVVAARDHLFFPEQEMEPHRPGALLLWSADEPNHWEDVSGTLALKVEALLCHASQSATTMGGAGSGGSARAAFERRIRSRAAANGSAVGLAAAEGFRRLTP